MTPEEKARITIDRWFNDSGWQVVNRDEYEANISAVAIREGLLEGNLEADYFLFINGKAIGVLEAKREEVDVSSHVVSEQVETTPKVYPVIIKHGNVHYLSYISPTGKNSCSRICVILMLTGKH